MLPGQACSAGHDIVIQKYQWLRRIDAQALKIRSGAIALNVVDAHEPRIFSIGDRKPSVISLIAWVRASHIVGNGPQMACFGQIQRALFLGDDVTTNEQSTIFHAMDVLRHLALAATAGTLMHEDQLILIGRNNRYGRTMVRRPAFALADIEQH